MQIEVILVKFTVKDVIRFISKIEKKYLAAVPVIIIMFILMRFQYSSPKQDNPKTVVKEETVDEKILGTGQNVVVIDQNNNEQASPNIQRLYVGIWRDEKDVIRDATAYFLKDQSGVEVEFVEIAYDQYFNSIEARMRKKEPLDVFFVKNVSQYALAVNKGFAENIETAIRGSTIDTKFYGRAFESLKINEGLYGLPYKRNVYALFYNRDILNASKVTLPNQGLTWDVYRRLARNIKMQTSNFRVSGAFIGSHPQAWYIQALQRGATLLDNDLSLFETAIRYRMALEQEGTIPRYAFQKKLNMHFNSEFQKGEIGMHVSGDWHVRQLLQAETKPFAWDVTTVPVPDDSTANVTIGNYSLGILSKDSLKKELALEYLKFLASSDGAAIIAQKLYIPGYLDQRAITLFEQNMPNAITGMGKVMNQNFVLEYPATVSGYLLAHEVFFEEAGQVFLGQQSIQDFSNNVRTRRSELP